MNIAPAVYLRRGFHRMGSRYGSLYDSDYIMGRNPWEDSWLAPSAVLESQQKNLAEKIDDPKIASSVLSEENARRSALM